MANSFQSSNTFLRSNNQNDQIEGRRSHQIFSFNGPEQNNQQRNTVQDRRDIDNIMQRYSKPQGSTFQSNFVSQQVQQSKNEENQGPVNFIDSQNFEDDNQYKQQSHQTYQVNYPNLLDEDTSLMTSLNVSRNPNDTQAFGGVVNPFMKNFDNSIRTDLDDQNDNQNYDKFHQFEHLDINQIANSNNKTNNGERVTFGGFNNGGLFDPRQSQVNNGGISKNNQQSQVNYSVSESQQYKQQGAQQNFKGINSPTSSQSNYSQNFNMASGQFGQLQQQSGNFGGQSKADDYADNDDNFILKDINNDDFGDNNIFGSDDDLTKQEEQEQRVNQMHAEISVLNDQVHKMLQNYKTQLDKQSDKNQVKQKVQKDASLLSKNYREIICKFDDLSQNDISMLSNSISMNSRSNMSFAGYSLLRGTTKKEKEINVMMNLVEQFLCKFDDDFQNQSVSRQDTYQQKTNNGIKQQQDEQYNKMIRDPSKQNDLQLEFNKLTMQQKQQDMPKSPLAQQYQLQNVNKNHEPPTQNSSTNIYTSFQTQTVSQQQQQNTVGRNTVSFDKAATDLASKYAKFNPGIQSNQSSSHSNSTTSTQNTMLDMDKILIQHKKDHQDNPFLSVQMQSPNQLSQGNTPNNNVQQPQIFFNGSFQPQSGQMNLNDEIEAVKRTQMPQLRQTSSAQPTLVQISSNPASPAVSPIQNQVYSQSTRTSGVNQFSLASTYGLGDQKSNNFLTPQKPTNYTILNYSANNSQQNSLNNIPQIQNVKSPIGSQNSLQIPSGNTLQVPNSPSLNAQITINSNTSPQSTTNGSNKNADIFNMHDQLDLYCTNCDQYFKSNVYFEHVKTCDKEHANKLNQTLDDTFYNLDQSAAIMNKLDQKIDKISRNISNALQLQNLPQTRDILSETIRDLAETLKSENSSVVKKIIRKIEQNAKKFDAASGNLPQSSSHKLYLYLKRVTNILREKESVLEQSAMLKEISLVYQPKQAPPAQQEQQQNFYAPRYSYQPNSNTTTNNTFIRNTVSTNTELEKKSKFYDIAGVIKNNLPPNHFGNQFLISELYEEAKNLQENEWQNYLKNKFNIKN